MSSNRAHDQLRDPTTGIILRGELHDGKNEITPNPETGGILLLEEVGMVNYNGKDKREFEVRLFASAALKTFVWTVDEGKKWQLIDVPVEFAIGNGDAIAAALSVLRDPPVIVHGRP